MKNLRQVVMMVGVAIAFSACGETDQGPTEGESDSVSDGQTGGHDDTVGLQTDSGEISADGTAQTGGGIPDCPFKPPTGATCNPYPGCPGTGCADSEMCTVVEKGDGVRRIECHAAGTVEPGGACDHQAGPFCSVGLCMDGECRGFCVDTPDCANNAACMQISGVPGKPTVCGATQAACDVLDAAASCESPGKTCYLIQNTGLTDCLDTASAGEQNTACDCAECCSAGFTCLSHENQRFCGRTCSLDEGTEPACQTVCAGMAIKNVTPTIGACIPSQEQPPKPDPIPCDILAQDCAGAAQGCYPTSQGDQCLKKGTLAAGAACQGVNECAVGLTCFANSCRPICDPNDPLHPSCVAGPAAQCPPLGGSSGGYCDE